MRSSNSAENRAHRSALLLRPPYPSYWQILGDVKGNVLACLERGNSSSSSLGLKLKSVLDYIQSYTFSSGVLLKLGNYPVWSVQMASLKAQSFILM